MLIRLAGDVGAEGHARRGPGRPAAVPRRLEGMVGQERRRRRPRQARRRPADARPHVARPPRPADAGRQGRRDQRQEGAGLEDRRAAIAVGRRGRRPGPRPDRRGERPPGQRARPHRQDHLVQAGHASRSACSGLPNGNTFVVCRNQLVEFDSRQHAVFTYQRQAAVRHLLPPKGSGTARLCSSPARASASGSTPRARRSSRSPVPRAMYIGRRVGGACRTTMLLVTQRDGVAEFDAARPVAARLAGAVSAGPRRSSDCRTATRWSAPAWLPNADGVAELDHDGHVVWEYKPTDGFVPWRARRR